MERANHRLALENAADKKHIKSLTGNIETLEQKCEELQGTIDDLRIQVDVLTRKAQQRSQADSSFERRSGIEVVRLRSVEHYGEDEVDSCNEPKITEHNENVSTYLRIQLSIDIVYNNPTFIIIFYLKVQTYLHRLQSLL